MVELAGVPANRELLANDTEAQIFICNTRHITHVLSPEPQASDC